MNLLRIQSLFMVLLFCVALMSITAPAAHAGLFGFIKRHLFSHPPSVQKKTAVTHHRSSSRKTAHRNKQDREQNLKASISQKIPSPRQYISKQIKKDPPAPTELAYNMPQDNSISSISNVVPPHGISVLSHQQILSRRVIQSDEIQPEKIVLTPQAPSIQFTKQIEQVQNIVPAPKSPAHTKHQKLVVLTPKYQAPIPEEIVQPKAAPIHYLSIQKNYNDKDASPAFDESVKPLLTEAPISSKMDDTASNTVVAQPATQKNNKDVAFSTRASWYGPGFDGKRTASGQRFNTNALTAASRTLKFGSQLLVANPATGKCCTVTINDRGPYVSGRDIDLSHGAAAKIGVTGVSPVICVAYAGESEPELIAKSSLSRSGKHKHSRTSTLSGAPAKVSPKVLHYIAGVM